MTADARVEGPLRQLMCCHPVLPVPAQLAQTLGAVGDMTAPTVIALLRNACSATSWKA